MGGGPGRGRGMAKPKNAKKTIARLIQYMGKFKGLLVIVFLAVVISAGASVACDALIKPALNDYILPLFNRFKNGETLGFVDYVPFLKLLVVMGLIFVLGAFASWLNSRLMLHISTKMLYKIRVDLFAALEKLPLKYFDAHTHGELMSLFTNDTDTLRDMMSQSVPQLFSSVISVVAVFIMMVTLSPLLTAIMLVTIFLMMLLAGAIGKKSANAFREQQKNIGAVNGYVEELIEGQRVVKVFNREQKAKEQFNVLNDKLCEAGTAANTYANILMPLMGNMSHVQYAIIAIVGAFRVIGGAMDIGSIAAFLQYTRSFSRPITMMSQQINGILNALAGAERIFAVIDEKDEVDQGAVTLVNATETNPSASDDKQVHLVQAFAETGEWAWRVPSTLEVAGQTADGAKSYADESGFNLIKLCGDVVFKDVSFGYVPEKEVLHHIDLHALPGQKIALVGSTGSGKTTITNLLTRFYDVEQGKGIITYDGIPLNEIKKDDLRKSLGMVLQDTHLFTGTIRDNIRYGNLEASEAQIESAAKLANADTFIRHLANGYDTVITGDGGNLSQGQRQLLAIARAAVADPPVLILDEATSSIDTRTEYLIEKGMDHLMEGRTVFVIAHRLSTVRNADEIIVLEKGEIIERGNHEQLLAKKGRYYSLYTGKFELD
jgi:ATP-binding cassette subfamily B protein